MRLVSSWREQAFHIDIEPHSLRVVANDTVERLRKRSLEMEKARLRAMQDEVARLPRAKEDKA